MNFMTWPPPRMTEFTGIGDISGAVPGIDTGAPPRRKRDKEAQFESRQPFSHRPLIGAGRSQTRWLPTATARDGGLGQT